MSQLADALARAMAERGTTATDLAADTGIKVGTIRNLMSGRTIRPRTREVRNALDDYFAAGMRGTTLAICDGRLTDYPSPVNLELISLVQPMSEQARGHLVGFLREIS